MVSANELRIGNKILRRNSNDYWIDTNVNLTYLSLVYEFPEDYKGIPLSEETLLKCGFVNDSYSNFNLYLLDEYGAKSEEYISIHFKDYACKEYSGAGFSDCYVEECKYLHQIQNLYFALTGKELEVKF